METFYTQKRILLQTTFIVAVVFLITPFNTFAIDEMSSANYSVGSGSTFSSGYVIEATSTSYISERNILNAIYSQNYNMAAVVAPVAPAGGGGGGGGGGMILTPSACTSSLVGDINCDGRVDLLDFNLLMVAWGKTGADIPADINEDGTVELLDFNLLMVNWTK